MKLSCRNYLMVLLAALALILSAMGVTPVLADEEVPPPPPTEQPALPPSGESAADSLVADPGLLEQLPADTSLVLLDESGEALPLANSQAAELLNSGDPMWCPANVTPGNDTLGECTDPHLSLTELILDLKINRGEYTGAGTIYVAWDYSALDPASPDYGANVTYEYNLSNVTDLTIQGGWVFDDPATAEVEDYLGSEPSDLTGINSLVFLDWGGDDSVGSPASLTINNIVIENGGWNGWTFGGGIFVGNGWLDSTSVDVSLSNVSVGSFAGDGAAILIDSGDVSVTNSSFGNNSSDGLEIATTGSVTLDGVTANMNTQSGVEISAGGDVNISRSTFASNSGSGLAADVLGSVTVDDVNSTGNQGDGLDIEAQDDINVRNAILNGNDTGARLESATMAQVFCSTASSGDWGVVAATPNLYLKGITFSGNISGDYSNTGNVWVNQYVCQSMADSSDAISDNRALYIIYPQTQAELPGQLGTGDTFASALKVVLTHPGDTAYIRAISLSFPIPENMKGTKLVVMFWNGSAWIEVPGGQVHGDFFVITVGQPGVYVLVGK